MWDTRRARSFYYYFNVAVADRSKIQKSLSTSPYKFLDFQAEFTRYISIIFDSIKATNDVWRELIKTNANEETLTAKIANLGKKNIDIENMYKNIIK